MSISEI